MSTVNRLIRILALALALTSCGGGGSADGADARHTPSTDRSGNAIRAGHDWSGIGAGGEAAADGDGGGGAAARGGGVSAGTPTTGELVCERPEPPDFDPSQAPPGFDPEAPLADAEDDFPFTVSVQPRKADAGAIATITTQSVYPDKVLVVLLARFSDGESHGMEAAKFADVSGRAVFKGPIPETAPEGFTTLTLSASTEDNHSALETLDFTVTGKVCA